MCRDKAPHTLYIRVQFKISKMGRERSGGLSQAEDEDDTGFGSEEDGDDDDNVFDEEDEDGFGGFGDEFDEDDEEELDEFGTAGDEEDEEEDEAAGYVETKIRTGCCGCEIPGAGSLAG